MTEPTGGAPAPPPSGDNAEAPPPAPQASAQQPVVSKPPAQAQGSWQAPPAGSQPQFQQAPMEAGPAPGVAYADLVTRIIAIIIDWLILGVVWTIVWTVVAGSLFVTSGFAMLAVAGIVLGVIWAAVSAVYFVYGWTRLRASPGQRVLGLETVNAADGATLSQDQAIQRWIFLFGIPGILAVLGNIVGLVGSLLGLIGLGYTIYLLYTASQSPKRQGFHDVKASTVVIKRTA
jgi:uncharacterized RDD family membrane protein YckC